MQLANNLPNFSIGHDILGDQGISPSSGVTAITGSSTKVRSDSLQIHEAAEFALAQGSFALLLSEETVSVSSKMGLSSDEEQIPAMDETGSPATITAFGPAITDNADPLRAGVPLPKHDSALGKIMPQAAPLTPAAGKMMQVPHVAKPISEPSLQAFTAHETSQVETSVKPQAAARSADQVVQSAPHESAPVQLPPVARPAVQTANSPAIAPAVAPEPSMAALGSQSPTQQEPNSQQSQDQRSGARYQKSPTMPTASQENLAQTASQNASSLGAPMTPPPKSSVSPVASAQTVIAPPQMQPAIGAAAEAAPVFRDAQPLERLVETITQMRESGQAARGELALRHSEFGMVAMRVSANEGELQARLSSRDPAFVTAVQSALNERPVAAPTETSQNAARQPDSGQNGHQGGHNNAHDLGGSARKNQSAESRTKGEHGDPLSPTDDHSQRKDDGTTQSASGLFA